MESTETIVEVVDVVVVRSEAWVLGSEGEVPSVVGDVELEVEEVVEEQVGEVLVVPVPGVV